MAATYNVDEGFDYALFDRACCAFGVFDGVHAGHRFIIGEAAAASERLGGARCVVVTFDRDPDELFAHGSLRKLMSNEARIRALASLPHVDAVAVLPFTREFAALAPDDFLEQTFGSAHVPAALHVGFDVRFGARAAGTVDDLAAWGASRGMSVVSHDLLVLDGAPVTSTRIRKLLSGGLIKQANALLGARYTAFGTVHPGRGEGADMGFATANLNVPEELRVLGDGVYAAYAHVLGVRYKAAVNVGVAPTFEGATANMEVHILDFAGDIVGEQVEVEFVEWLRPMKKFDDVDVLIKTVMGNINWVRDNL